MACRNFTLPDGRSGRAVALHFLAQTDSDDRLSMGTKSSGGPGKFLDPQQVRRLSAGAGDPAGERAPSSRIVSLVVARDIEDVSQPLAAFFFGLLLVGGLILGSGAAAVELAVRWGLRPVLDLNRKVAAIEASTSGVLPFDYGLQKKITARADGGRQLAWLPGSALKPR